MGKSKYTQLTNEEELKKILLCQAVLDIVMTDEEDSWLRLINYYKNYNDDVDMVKIDNGSGDHMYIMFSKHGTIIKGFDHESELSPYANDEGNIAKGIYDFVPDELMNLLSDESVERDDVTFCIWRSKNDPLWKKGKDLVSEGYKYGVDGEVFLLGFIFDTAESWLDWAKDYFEEDAEKLHLSFVKNVYDLKIEKKEIEKMIDQDRDIEKVIDELKQIGYF